MNLRLRQRCARIDQLLRHGFAMDPLRVEPGAVVGDGDDNVAALVIGGERQPSLRRLAGAAASFGILDAVIDAVPQHVHQRIADFLDDLAIELRVFAGDDQVEGFA